MLRLLLMLFLLASCSMGVISKGGEAGYEYRAVQEYDLPSLRSLAPKVIMTTFREPPVGRLKQLFSRKMPDLKRVAIIVFETNIQSSRSGLASESGLVYPTAAGKQLITEDFLSIWDEALPLIFPEGEYVQSQKVKSSQALHKGGAEVEDYIKSDRSTIAPDDVTYLEKGKATAMQTILNPRGMQDLSFVLVPAMELLGGPKWSEHQKHLVNEVVEELKLDAAIVVMSTVSWDGGHKDPLTGDALPEELHLKIEASTILPFSKYQERLNLLGVKDYPQVNIVYRSYQGSIKVPLKINLPESERNFENIEKNLLDPLFRHYRDLAAMTMVRMSDDWKKTF